MAITIDSVNGTDIVKTNSDIFILGSFSAVAAVYIDQPGAPRLFLSFVPTSATRLDCTGVDFHTVPILPDAATLTVTDGSTPVAQPVTIDFTNLWQEISATSISAKGAFKNIPSAAPGSIGHFDITLLGSVVTVNPAGVFVLIDPSIPNNTVTTWWHGDPASHAWTKITATITRPSAFVGAGNIGLSASMATRYSHTQAMTGDIGLTGTMTSNTTRNYSHAFTTQIGVQATLPGRSSVLFYTIAGKIGFSGSMILGKTLPIQAFTGQTGLTSGFTFELDTISRKRLEMLATVTQTIDVTAYTARAVAMNGFVRQTIPIDGVLT
jgi:hypothetical protein